MKPVPLTEAEIDALPAACGRGELMRAFGVGHSRFNILRREGAFDLFLLSPVPAARRPYSGAVLKAHLRGDVINPDRAYPSRRLRRVS